jgi:hypothetical protein
MNLLNRLWMRYQCWRWNVCYKHGTPMFILVYGKFICAECMYGLNQKNICKHEEYVHHQTEVVSKYQKMMT